MADDLSQFLPYMRAAIKQAENDPTGKYGIRSVNTNSPGGVLDESIANNYSRWSAGKTPAPWIQDKPERFVDFMQKRWAPTPAPNDPKGLNKNWAPNVRHFLQLMAGPELYNYWLKKKLVQANTGVTVV